MPIHIQRTRTSVNVKRRKSDDSSTSLPDTRCQEVVFPTSAQKVQPNQRLCSSPTGAGGNRFRQSRLRQSSRVNGSTVFNNEVGGNCSELRIKESMMSPKSAILKHQSQRLKSRQSTQGNFRTKIDKNSKLYVGRNLLLQDKKPIDNKEEFKQRKKRIDKKSTGQLNQKTLQKTINSEESVFVSPDHNLRPSLLTPDPEI